ncbi:MAG: hypothetical protein JNK87_21240 [Bryobacterales bacterium]|nr:hypothetical protein [Bryobacterales bacterium]
MRLKTVLLALILPLLLPAQMNLLSVAPPPKLTAKRGTTAEAKLNVQLQNGYHVNSNKPADEYLIPLRLTWTAESLVVDGTTYPTPKMEKYEFSQKPLSVYTGDFQIATKFKVPSTAPLGMKVISGKLRYQACSHKECFPPKSVEVKLPIDIVN